jgi:hypothetical protein
VKGIEPSYAAWEAAYEDSIRQPLTPQILSELPSSQNAATYSAGSDSGIPPE